MRILMVSPGPNIMGPLPKHTPLLVAALRELGCDLITGTWGRHSDRESLADKFVGRAQDVICIRRTLRENAVDVLVVKTAHDWRTLLRDVSLLLGTRRLCPTIVLQFHGSFSDRLVSPGHVLFKAASAWLIRSVDAALLLSSEELSQWREFYPAGKFHLVANPYLAIDDSRHGTSTLRWALPQDRPVLLFAGKLMRAKGIFDLLSAMPLILERTACHLFVAGDGPQAGQVQEYVAELGLTDHVTLAGYLQGRQLAAAYATARILVLPTYWAEGFPTVITEAMDAGLPIVTTRIRGAADHLEEGVNALFVPPRDPAAIANAVERLLSDPALCALMAHANQEKVKDFAPEKVAREYLSILEEIV
jgi:glycosyltransferase involved in cell wall biosynthesis